MSAPGLTQSLPVPGDIQFRPGQSVQGGSSAYALIGAALVLSQLRAAQDLRVAALPPGAGQPPGVPNPFGPLNGNETQGVNPPAPAPEKQKFPLLEKVLQNQQQQGKGLAEVIWNLRNQPVTPPGKPSPFPRGISPPQALPIPQAVLIEKGDLADKALRAELENRSARGTFEKTPVLGAKNLVPAPPGLAPPAPQPLPGPVIPDLTKSGLHQFLKELQGLPVGRVGIELTIIKQMPVPSRPNIVADTAIAAGIAGTGALEGARVGGPIGAVAGAAFFSTVFISRALRENAASLEGSPPVAEIAARDPNPSNDPGVSARLRAFNRLQPDFTETVGPPRDC